VRRVVLLSRAFALVWVCLAAASLQSQIAADAAKISATTGGLQRARLRLAGLQGQLGARQARG
jgi:hypothetical protein